MDAKESALIIDTAGGDTAFARLLKIDGTPGYRQRVNNWRRRGIPSAVVLCNYSKITKLRRLAKIRHTAGG